MLLLRKSPNQYLAKPSKKVVVEEKVTKQTIEEGTEYEYSIEGTESTRWEVAVGSVHV